MVLARGLTASVQASIVLIVASVSMPNLGSLSRFLPRGGHDMTRCSPGQVDVREDEHEHIDMDTEIDADVDEDRRRWTADRDGGVLRVFLQSCTMR